MAYCAHLYCVSNNNEILEKNLLSSPDVAEGLVPFTIIRDAPSASAGYHTALGQATADILIFAHQDIFFPKGWFVKLLIVCDRLDHADPSWAVAGLFGVSEDGQFEGHVWDSALGFVCGGPFGNPCVATSLDEIVLVLRRASGISFELRVTFVPSLRD